MQTRVVLLPGALENEGEPPLFPSGSATIGVLQQRACFAKVSTQLQLLPEAQWIGLAEPPNLAEGVLAVSSLGADPPKGSVHFCMTLMSTDGHRSNNSSFPPDESVLEVIWQKALTLETSCLKMVRGVGVDHALVWEDGSIEMKCFTPEELASQGLTLSFPEGDGEQMLRRLIDDSINLLSEIEVNRIRQEEGLERLNLLWPWGPGFRPRLPNLTMERGMSVQIESPSSRLKGLSRLVGYRHGDPWSLGSGTNVKLEQMTDALQKVPMGLAVMPTVGEFRQKEKQQEASWLGNEVLSRLVEPLLFSSEHERMRILLIATQRNGEGLALDFRSDAIRENRDIPFSAEALEEKSLLQRNLGPIIAEALTA